MLPLALQRVQCLLLLVCSRPLEFLVLLILFEVCLVFDQLFLHAGLIIHQLFQLLMRLLHGRVVILYAGLHGLCLLYLVLFVLFQVLFGIADLFFQAALVVVQATQLVLGLFGIRLLVFDPVFQVTGLDGGQHPFHKGGCPAHKRFILPRTGGRIFVGVYRQYRDDGVGVVPAALLLHPDMHIL